jgi:hypothetical protein
VNEYAKVMWIHEFIDEPTEIWVELDSRRLEKRKIEIFPNGEVGRAKPGFYFGKTRPSIGEYPPWAEVELDPQFVVEHVDRKAFDSLWSMSTPSAAWLVDE